MLSKPQRTEQKEFDVCFAPGKQKFTEHRSEAYKFKRKSKLTG